jgi:hypothetical protein
VVLALISFSKGREGAEAWVDPMRILVTVSQKLVSYLTDDVVGKPGMLNMVVEALAAVLFADKVGDEAKEVIVIAVVVGDLGRMVTMLLAKGANDAAVLDVILTSPVVDVDANTTITDRSELFLDLIRILWDVALLVHCHDGEDPRAATGGGHMPPSRPTPRRSCSTLCYRNSKSFP